MNRSKAKIISAAGIFACSLAVAFTIYSFIRETMFAAQMFFAVLFVGGVVLIILSLAYFTER
jgi:uncharacterized membrane protein YdbT with pleckstrin-like domain